jgi:hypothetical protein
MMTSYTTAGEPADELTGTTTPMLTTAQSSSPPTTTTTPASLSSLLNRGFVNAFLWARGSVRWALFLLLSNWIVVHVLVLRVWHFDGSPRTDDSQLCFVDALLTMLGVGVEWRSSVEHFIFWSFHVAEAALAYCWLWCVFADPGFLSKELASASDADEWPPALRAQYCRRSRRCVERMDHFCVWIGQPVGARNHKTFLIYTALSLVLLLFDALALWTRLAEIVIAALLFQSLPADAATHAVPVLLFAALYSACAYSVLALFLLQCELIYRDETTFEWLTRMRANKERRHGDGGGAAPPNDWRNVRRFFGENWLEILNIHRAVPPTH